jgi:hypothetical protein
MFTVIAAAITAIFGAGSHAIDANAANYQMWQAQQQQSISFSQAKDLSYYQAYANSSKQLVWIAVIGFLFLAVLMYLILR